MVLESRDAVEAKSEIKSAGFQLKKISDFTAKPFLQKEFLEAVKTTAEYFVATSGNILAHLIPSFILENPNVLSILKENKNKEIRPDEERKNKKDVAVLQAPDEERFAHYRSLIREEFAKKKSVFLFFASSTKVSFKPALRNAISRNLVSSTEKSNFIVEKISSSGQNVTVVPVCSFGQFPTTVSFVFGNPREYSCL